MVATPTTLVTATTLVTLPEGATLPEVMVAFLEGYGLTAELDREDRGIIRAQRQGGKSVTLTFSPGYNLVDILVTVTVGGEYREQVRGRHTIAGGDPVYLGCIGHTCLNAVNANSF